jgi:metal-sulfur cluster biosynthetic enzyme
LSREEVLGALERCYDPCCREREISVVDMGLIESIMIAARSVHIKMVLTTGWCPFAARLLEMIETAVGELEGVDDVDVKVVWNPTWTPQRMSEGAREKLRLPLQELIPLREARLGKEKA